MKSDADVESIIDILSPSTRREWIEMLPIRESRQPHRQSPSTRREWIEIATFTVAVNDYMSPSTRREWIEISLSATLCGLDNVSLHTEGVD